MEREDDFFEAPLNEFADDSHFLGGTLLFSSSCLLAVIEKKVMHQPFFCPRYRDKNGNPVLLTCA